MKILLTGACSGLGAFLREKLIAAGHFVYGVGLKGPDFKIDFAAVNPDKLHDAADRIFADAEFVLGGDVEVLVNNAGTSWLDPLAEVDMEEFYNTMLINTMWPFALSLAMLERYPDQYLRIVNTTSTAAVQPMTCSHAYCASKSALDMAMKCLARETASSRKVTVINIAPDVIKGTGMSERVNQLVAHMRNLTVEQAAKTIEEPLKMGRCTVEDLWPVYRFAVEAAPNYMSGTTITLSGGRGL